MLGFLIGIRGDKEKGIRTVQEVAKNGKLNRVDAEIFLCALYRRENQSKLAVPLVQDLIRRYPRNYLLRMELAQMYSQAGDGVRGLAGAGGGGAPQSRATRPASTACRGRRSTTSRDRFNSGTTTWTARWRT